MTPRSPLPSRRRFLQSATTLAVPFLGWKTAARGAAPSDTLRFACVGAAGRAWGNITSMAGVPGCTFAAVAEVDPGRTANVARDFPDTKVYTDWRELLDKEGGSLDALIVSTPDHLHAPIAMSAMQLGIHVYCEKPLARTLHECRQLKEYAAEKGLVSQMGIQVASSSGNLTAVDLLRRGIVGKIKTVHSMNPKSWGSLDPLPQREDPVPEGLDWDLWIGPAKMRPFLAGEFHPSNWRKRIGYGTGTLGDMGCHIYHPWFAGLNAPAPLSVISRGPAPVDAHSWPLNALVQYRMKGNTLTDGDFDFVWYDGTQFPDESVWAVVGGREGVPTSGSLVIGTEGALVIPHGGSGTPTIYRDGKLSEEAIEHLPAQNHHQSFADAIRGQTTEAPLAHFGYAGPMSETVLLGTVAMLRPGEELQWDHAAGRFSHSEAANELLHDPYRPGWEVAGLS